MNSLLFSEPRRTGGFTLVEIFIVAILVAVAALLSVPRFSSAYSKMYIEKTAGDVRSLMRLAQGRAIVRGAPIHMKFEEDFHRYRFFEEGLSSEGEGGLIPLSGRWGNSSRIPGNISIEGGLSTVEFRPDGTIDPVTLRLCYREQCRRISTEIQRGRIMVF